MKYKYIRNPAVTAEVASDGTVIQGYNGKYEVMSFVTKETLDSDPKWVIVKESQDAPAVKRIQEVEEESAPPKKKKKATKQVKEEVVEPEAEGDEA